MNERERKRVTTPAENHNYSSKITTILLEQQLRKENARNSTRECGQMDANSDLRSDNSGYSSKHCGEHPGQWARTQRGHGNNQAEAKSRAYKAHGNS